MWFDRGPCGDLVDLLYDIGVFSSAAMGGQTPLNWGDLANYQGAMSVRLHPETIRDLRMLSGVYCSEVASAGVKGSVVPYDPSRDGPLPDLTS